MQLLFRWIREVFLKGFCTAEPLSLEQYSFPISCGDHRSSEGSSMYAVQCPHCGSVVDIPDEAVGTNRTHCWNVARCNDCDTGFDYDDEEIQLVLDESEAKWD
jgi:hypothetical protein